MTDNIPVRAATSGELIKFRGSGQWGKLGLAIRHPVTVYTARINQTFDTLEGVYEFAYDGGSDTLANVLINMTLFIGSSAGAYDKGICRVRQLPTADMFYINETSDISFADNDHVTVIDHMAIWPRDITETGGTVMMDYDIEFGSSLNGGVIPRIGPLVSALRLTGATVNFTPPSPALSAAYDGATIVSYLYDAPGASATTNMTTTAPTFTYNAAGEYRWSCAITDDLGRVTTAYRWLFVEPDPINFKLESCGGDYETGYWSFEVTCFNNVSISDIYDRAMVALYAEREYYDGVKGSIGKIAGYENIKCVGWIRGESIVYDSESGDVTFTVQGPGYWLEKIRAFPFELIDTSAAPTNWKQIQEMTVDKALAHILFWTSTAPTVMDCFFTGNTTRIKSLVEPSGSLIDQIQAIATDKLFAKPLCNNYGQMFVEIDPQLIASADRDALTVVMDITSADWGGERDVDVNQDGKTSQLEISAYSNYDGVTVAKVYSRAPGKNPKPFGAPDAQEDYVAFDQDELNRISGDLLAAQNNDYEPLTIELKQRNPLIDIAPRMYCTTTIAAVENPRGIALTDVRLIPRKVELVPDQKSGTYLTVVVFELETSGAPGVTYYPIDIGDDDIDLIDDGIGDFPDDGIDFPPDVPPVETACSDAISNNFSLQWSIKDMRGDAVDTLISKAYFPCKIRATGGIYPTYLDMDGTWYGDAPDNYAVYAVAGGSRVLTATVSNSGHHNRAEFDPVSDTAIDGFEIELTAGLGSVVSYIPKEIIGTGSVAATVDINEIPNVAEVGNYYSFNASGGPYQVHDVDPPDPWPLSYAFYAGNGGRVAGPIGLSANSATTSAFYLVAGDLGVKVEALDGRYGMVYFQATDTALYFVCGDTVKSDNSGSIGWVLRNVEVKGRRIVLGGSVLHNVCAI